MADLNNQVNVAHASYMFVTDCIYIYLHFYHDRSLYIVTHPLYCCNTNRGVKK